jgi:zinc protease
MKSFRLLFLLFFVSSSSVFAQQNLNDTLPVDPNVRIGKLNNGLTYYIRENKKPEQKIELRLVVNAGSILEDDDQQGLAHFCEHMAFRGTKHFKKNDIISFLQSIGVEFGNDLNAETFFDQTIYILPIPTDKPDNIDKGFQILEDWAHYVTYDSSDIDSERPVVLEEMRLGKGANDRMYRQIYPEIFAGSLYAHRLPIGIDSIIRKASYQTIRRFYHDWYRPDLMAVVVVGDIDPSAAESLVKKYFDDLQNPSNERPRIHPVVPPYVNNSAKVVTDKEATNYTFIINYSTYKKEPVVTLDDYKKEIEKNLFISLFNERLHELTQKENPPFVYAFGSFDSYARGYESFSANIGMGNSDSLSGLEAFEEELERVKKYGFTQAELERVKKDMLAGMERMYNERNKTQSDNYAEEYIRNFLDKEPIPGIANEYKYYQELLPEISITEVNALGTSLQENPKQFIALLGPEPSPGKRLPTGGDLLAIVDSVQHMNVTPYKEKIISSTLLKKLPKPGKIVAAKTNAVLGTTTYTLSNGITVTVKPTNFKNDEILMSAIRPGGKTNFGLKDKYNVQYATSVISSMGVGDFTPVDLQKALAGKTLKLSPLISNISEGMTGSSSVKDLESMLQLMYLYFTAPRMDTALFKSFIQRNKAQVAFLSSNPQVVFIDSLYNTIYHNEPLAPIAVPKAEYFDKIDLDRVMQIYKEQFGNAYGMHFTFVGNINENNFKSLLEQYVASLPAKAKKFTYADNKVRPVKGKINFTVHTGKEQKSLIVVEYNGEMPYSDSIDMAADAVSEILNIRIIEELRQKISGIYTGGTESEFEKLPYPHYSFVLYLPCGPEKVDTLIYAANQEIEKLVKNGPSKENLEKVKQQWIEQYKVNVKENQTWLSELQSFYFPGDNFDYFTNYEKHVNALTRKEIQDAAIKIFGTKNVVTGILYPEEK